MIRRHDNCSPPPPPSSPARPSPRAGRGVFGPQGGPNNDNPAAAEPRRRARLDDARRRLLVRVTQIVGLDRRTQAVLYACPCARTC